MKRPSALFAATAACLVFMTSAPVCHATDVSWKSVTYHDATIESVDGDQVMMSGTREFGGNRSQWKMPLSNVPDEVIRAYRTTRDRARRENRTATPTPAASSAQSAEEKAAAADRATKLATLKDALAKDPFHPVLVAGHIIVKNDEGAVILCDG